MRFQKLLPAVILKRIKSVNGHRGYLYLTFSSPAVHALVDACAFAKPGRGTVRKAIGQPAINDCCIGQSRSLTTHSKDLPFIAFSNQLHLPPLPPPAIDLIGKSEPNVAFVAQLRKILEKLAVECAFPFLHDVIRMND